MNKETQLIVNTAIEASYLSEPQIISTPLGEYGSLPWVFKEGGNRPMDIHFENAYLAEEVIYPPFQNESMILESGVHLHWIIPAFFGKEYAKGIPAAPNRWSVKRDDGKEWLVVSDYVHAPKVENNIIELTEEYSILPIPASAPNLFGNPPFCYLGKHFTGRDLEELDESLLIKNSYKKHFGEDLTVLGFGHVQFSASYPNCKTVFGFHDPDGKVGNIYSIEGWHSKPEDDLLKNSIAAEFTNTEINLTALKEFLSHSFDLDLEGDPDLTILPDKTSYLAKINIDNKPAVPNTDGLNISVGNTGTEAISALVSQKLNSSDSVEKVKAEDNLEYFLMNATMDGHLVDHFYKFLEARHKKGFTMNKGGFLYTFKDHYIGKTPDFDGYPLSPDLYIKMNALNLTRYKINEAENELKSIKSQLNVDWHKYMRAAYPPLGSRGSFPDRDELENLIRCTSFKEITLKSDDITKWSKTEQNQLKELSDLIKSFIQESISKHPYSDETTINEKRRAITSLKAELSKATTTKARLDINQHLKQVEKNLEQLESDAGVHAKLQDELTKAKTSTEDYPFKHLIEKPFWEPNEPVVAIDGFNFGNRSSVTHCQIVSLDTITSESTCFATQKMSELEWCPFFMEWDVSLEDAPIDINGLSSKELQNSFLDNYFLDYDSPGIYKKNQEALTYTDNDSYFQGGVILNPFLQDFFKEGMANYKEFCAEKIKENKGDQDAIDRWQKHLSLASKAKDKVEESNILCQRLSGFNAACLMLRQIPQLEMQEPVGFLESVNFTEAVLELVEGGDMQTPSVMYDFLPIRNGKLVLSRLRFINNFGTSVDMNKFSNYISSDTLTSEELRKSDAAHSVDASKMEELFQEVFLPPRIVQPARLNFHFLEGEHERMTENPNTSPVCGWFISNYLEGTIMVFSSEGKALGTIEKETVKWKNLPWEKQGSSFEDKIENPYLADVVRKIIQNDTNSGGGFTDAFLSAMEDALNQIAPADVNSQNAKILLVGRPIAICRVKIGLQIKGYPALDQSWQVTMKDAKKAENLPDKDLLSIKDRYSSNWNGVKIPLRLGEHHQLNDGLVGYWKNKDGQPNGSFFAPQTQNDAHELITSFSEGYASSLKDNLRNPFIHPIQADGEEHSFTVLLDPKGVLHATTGVLPTEMISIPTHFYQSALERMHLWFKTGPLLQYNEKLKRDTEEAVPVDVLQLDLPQIPKYNWKWFDKKTTVDNDLEKMLIDTQKPEFAKLYEELPEIKNGYLLLIPMEEKKGTS